jgi:translation initiation factor 1A
MERPHNQGNHQKRPHGKSGQQEEPAITRVFLPRDKQCFGFLDQRLGASRMRVRCFDGKVRICRIPGRLKRNLWVREGDIVVVEPWELGGDEKGDILYKYTKPQVQFLKEKGHLKNLEEFEEF